MRAQHAAVEQQQALELVAWRARIAAGERFPADEIARAVLEIHRPLESGLVGRNVFVHVLAVEVHAGFEAQGVACTEAAGLDAGAAQLVPDEGGLAGGQGDFETVLAGVAGACHQPVGFVEAHFGGLENAEAFGGGTQVGESLPEALACLRALHRDHGHGIDAALAPFVGARPLRGDDRHGVAAATAAHFQLGIEMGQHAAHPGHILFRGAGIDHDAVTLGAEVIHDQVVDHAAALVEHAGIQRLAWHGQLGHVVGQQVPQVVAGTGADKVQRAHVRNVEHAGIAAHGMVFLDLGTVMDGHFPAGEIDHLGAGGEMGVVERSA